MKFSDIPAHEAVKNRLRAMADSGRLPHALLLEGPSGIGKFALARAFAQYIHCENRVDGEPCGVCPSCRQHETFNHIDTYFSYPVLGGSNTVSDDYAKEWRHFLSVRVFMNFEAWRKNENAEAFSQLTKGTLLTVEGYCKPEEWTDKDGVKHNRIVMVATKFYPAVEKEDTPSQK